MSKAKELLIELFSEEIPARMQAGAMENLKTLFSEKMSKRGIDFACANTYVTPRRLVLHVRGLPERQEDTQEERRGPRTDAPQSAIDGFLASTGLTLKDCERRETPKGAFYFATLKRKGEPLREILPEIVREIIHEFPWPKSMRWAGSRRTWVRPLHSGVCVFDGRTVSFDVRMGEETGHDVPCVPFGNLSYGHRFLNPDPFRVEDFAQYSRELHTRYVMIDREERKKAIVAQGQKLAEEVGCQWRHDSGLLEEVAGLVEWPVSYRGSIDPSFMRLPPEVLITSMRVHQRYFTLETPEGELAPYFIIVANTMTRNKGQDIVIGNERVLKARLSDATFFYEQDKKIPLIQHARKLQNIVFHERLGTMAEKTDRLKKAARTLAPKFGLNPDVCVQAAEILKADLTTEMVGEFPELQGIMGRYYALAEGLNPEIAQAIAEHYSPRGSQDQLPISALGRLLALIDRLDALVGFFAVNIKPTGSKDPYALRRAALGIIRLLEEEQADFNLDEAIYSLYATFTNSSEYKPVALLHFQLKEFLGERLKVYWREQGISHDVISAAFETGRTDSLYVLKRRCQALQDFLKGSSSNEVGAMLLSAYRRASNIVRIEERKDNLSHEGEVDVNLLEEPAEKRLFKTLQAITPSIQKDCAAHQFASAMNQLATLKPFVDAYFKDVIVNADIPEVRINRLRTLSLFRSTMEKIADFSKIEDTL